MDIPQGVALSMACVGCAASTVFSAGGAYQAMVVLGPGNVIDCVSSVEGMVVDGNVAGTITVAVCFLGAQWAFS